MSYEYLRLEVQENVARLTLCRPERANAVNIELARELNRAARECRDNPKVRAVVLASEGKLFCAGGDLAAFADSGADLPAALEELLTEVHGAIETFSTMDAPVIAEIAGTAAGAGVGLVSSCSMAYATRDSKFTLSFTGVGLTPDSSSTWNLPRLIGWRRAEELMLTNRVLSAPEAAEWGLINACHDDAETLQAEVSKLAARLAAGPSRAFGGVRRLLESSASNNLHDQLALEGASIVNIASSQDVLEGVDAFMNKRKPDFKGV